jgi:hypothetical protein
VTIFVGIWFEALGETRSWLPDCGDNLAIERFILNPAAERRIVRDELWCDGLRPVGSESVVTSWLSVARFDITFSLDLIVGCILGSNCAVDSGSPA